MDCADARGFRFGIKAHQVITHIKRLKDAEEFLPRFVSTIEPLAQAGKLGPVLFQLPPNMKADPNCCEDFCRLFRKASRRLLNFVTNPGSQTIFLLPEAAQSRALRRGN